MGEILHLENNFRGINRIPKIPVKWFVPEIVENLKFLSF